MITKEEQVLVQNFMLNFKDSISNFEALSEWFRVLDKISTLYYKGDKENSDISYIVEPNSCTIEYTGYHSGTLVEVVGKSTFEAISKACIEFISKIGSFPISGMDTNQYKSLELDRVEVVNYREEGRVYYHGGQNSKVTLSFQDNNRTLKIFIY